MAFPRALNIAFARFETATPERKPAAKTPRVFLFPAEHPEKIRAVLRK
jgi:hypothetical protein